jgi:predicted phosphodiesterase
VLRVAAVITAGLIAGLGALWTFSSEREVSAGRVELSVSPFHRGSLDVYVPVVDWGVRFPGVRLPARLHAEVRAIDRHAAASLATGDRAVVDRVRTEARDAIASYLTSLAAVVAGSALLGAALMVLVLRSPPRHVLYGLVPAVVWVAAVALLLAPRGSLDDPEYYAQGDDIPVALRAVQKATRSSANLGEVIDEQLVGLARLVAPGERETLKGLPRLVVASDLHNNVLAIEALQRAAGNSPVLFVGDLSDSGTPVEVAVLRQITRTGRPFVFVGGNHDSDAQMLALARSGAIVLTPNGRLMPDGSLGPVVNRIAGLRMAGYTSPNLRRAADGYRDRGGRWHLGQQARFQRWLLGLAGKVDVVLVHEPQIAAPGLAAWRARHPDEPLLVATGHTHEQAVIAKGSVVMVNGGTIGAGGTGNLHQEQDIGLAVVTVQRDPFRALAADLVQIDPDDGSSTARRERLPAPWSSQELEAGAGPRDDATRRRARPARRG